MDATFDMTYSCTKRSKNSTLVNEDLLDLFTSACYDLVDQDYNMQKVNDLYHNYDKDQVACILRAGALNYMQPLIEYNPRPVYLHGSGKLVSQLKPGCRLRNNSCEYYGPMCRGVSVTGNVNMATSFAMRNNNDAGYVYVVELPADSRLSWQPFIRDSIGISPYARDLNRQGFAGARLHYDFEDETVITRWEGLLIKEIIPVNRGNSRSIENMLLDRYGCLRSI